MELRGFACSECGPVREHNEDSTLIDNALELFIVCDGMGGLHGGEIASAVAAKSVRDYFASNTHMLQAAREGRIDRRAVRNVIQEAGQYACKQVWLEAARREAPGGMGTTLTFVIACGTHAYVGHVGDSRAYLARGSKLHQVTRDHTLREELLNRGLMDSQSPNGGDHAHILTRAIGTQESVAVDVMRIDLIAGDAIILCSDGVYSAFTKNSELLHVLGDADLDHAPGILVREALARHSSDNASAIVIYCCEGERRAQAVQSDEILLRIEALKRVFMFQDLELRALLRVIERCYVVEVKAGEEVIARGSSGSHLFMILEGDVRVHAEGRELAHLRQGNHFGEMALLNDAPRSASVQAVTDARMLRISREDFLGLLRDEPATGVELLLALSKELSSRLASTNQLLNLV